MIRQFDVKPTICGLTLLQQAEYKCAGKTMTQRISTNLNGKPVTFIYIGTNTCELTGDRINHWTNQVLSLNRWTMQYRFISLLTPKNIELDCFRYFYLKIQKKYLSN